jgi:serine/threonine protein kinase
MSFCLNPHCPSPHNPDDGRFCAGCGQKLVLRDRYRAMKLIGQGGFGRTFQAIDEDKPSKPFCAIKQFFPLFDDRNALDKATELFEQEAIALEGLDHPHIPKLLAYFVTEDSSRYLVQEYIDGQNLRAELAGNGAMSVDEVKILLTTLLPTLGYIHERGYIHRDIKPENIIRRQRDRALYLVDFGAAKMSVSGGNPQGTTIGTPEFMAPEQSWGQAFFASDLYSFGVTCIHLLTGISPFNLYDDNNGEWLWREKVSADFDPNLAAVLNKLIAQIPRDRYQTASEVINDLSAYFTLPPVTIPAINTGQTRSQLTNSISAPARDRLDCIYTYNWHRKPIDAIELSADGQFLISGDESGTVALWNLALEQPIATYCTHHPTWAVAISPDRSQIASGDKNRRIQLRRAEAVMTSMRELHADYQSMDSHHGFVCALSFSPDGKILASGGSDGQIRLWDSDRSHLITTFTGHQQAVTAVKFLPPGQILVSTGADRTLRFWDVTSRQLLKTITSHTDKIHDLAVGGSGKVIVTGSSDRTVRVRQLGTTDDRILSGHQETVLAVAITPDGKYIASGCLDGQIWLWNGLTGELIHRSIAHESAIRSMAFAADNRTLITASWDRAIKVWKVNN